MVSLEDALVSGGLVLLGFFLRAVWEAIASRRAQEKERRRIFTIFRLETEENASDCEELIKRVGESAPQKIAPLVPIPRFHILGWSVALSNWPLLRLDSELGTQLGDAYELAGHINELFRMRERFAITNMSLSTYEQVMDSFDSVLRDACQQYLGLHEKIRPGLAKHR